MKTKKIKIINKIQKPIDYDLHLKYRCSECNQDHWLSYLESSTKNFKIVCDCGHVFKVKRVSGFRLKYDKSQQKYRNTKPSIKNPDTEEKLSEKIPDDLLKAGCKILESFGYSLEESKELLMSAYAKEKTVDLASLVKNSLSNLEI